MLKKVDMREGAQAASTVALRAPCAAEFKRWSIGRKRAVVLRLLRGESTDAVFRDVGVTLAELEQWRELALAGIEAGLKSRQTDPLEVKLKEAV
ncbi:MAG: hypothetical protein VB124_04375, partial [Burkholderia sp.]